MRFSAVAYLDGNGVLGNGNSQLIELLPPGRVGPNKTYKLQVALDGVHFEENSYVMLTINTDQVENEYDFEVLKKGDLRKVKVYYRDQETGEDLAKCETFQGYDMFKADHFGIVPKEIQGYKLVKSPEGMNLTINKKKEFVYEYRKEIKEHMVGTFVDLRKVLEEMNHVKGMESYRYAIINKQRKFDTALYNATKVVNESSKQTETSVSEENNWESQFVGKIYHELMSAYKALDGHAPTPDKMDLYMYLDNIDELMNLKGYKDAPEKTQKRLKEAFNQAMQVFEDPQAIIPDIRKENINLMTLNNEVGPEIIKNSLKHAIHKVKEISKLELYKEKMFEEEQKNVANTVETAKNTIDNGNLLKLKMELEQIQGVFYKVQKTLGIGSKSMYVLNTACEMGKEVFAQDLYKNANDVNKLTFDKAFEKAQEVLALPYATEEQVEVVLMNLNQAGKALNGRKTVTEPTPKNANKDALKVAIEKANEILTKDLYKNADVTKKIVFHKALKDARRVLVDVNANAETVKKVKSALDVAREMLDGQTVEPKVVDQKSIHKTVEKAEQPIGIDIYKKADASPKVAFNIAIKGTKDVITNKKVDQQKVDKVRTDVEKPKKVLDDNKPNHDNSRKSSKSETEEKVIKSGNDSKMGYLVIASILLVGLISLFAVSFARKKKKVNK